MVRNLRLGKVVKAFYDGRNRKYVVRELALVFRCEAARCEEIGGHGNDVTFLVSSLEDC